MTDIGILLIVLCVLLWAIMAALHRHTVQLEALKARLDALLDAQQSKPSHAPETGTAGRGDHEDRVMPASNGKRA